MHPLVSIIIPTFNRSDLLERSLKSVLSQSYNNYEIIIIDNCSTDNTQIVIEKYKNYNVKAVQVNNDGVIGLSRNIGLKNSNGEFIAFLDSDDWWKKDKLKNVIKIFNSNHKVDLIYHNCYLISNNESKLSKCRALPNNCYRNLIVNGNTLITSSVVFKKKILDKVGYFSEDKNKVGWEDYDLWLRIAESGYNFYLIKSMLGYYWTGENNFDNPKRVLINLENIEKKIILPYLKKNQNDQIWWVDYTRAIAYYKLKKRDSSYKSFKKVLFNKTPILYKLKAVFYILKLLLV